MNGDGWDHATDIGDVALDAIARGNRVRVLVSHRDLGAAVLVASGRAVDVQLLSEALPRGEVDVVILAGDVVNEGLARALTFDALYQGIVIDLRVRGVKPLRWRAEAARRSHGAPDDE